MLGVWAGCTLDQVYFGDEINLKCIICGLIMAVLCWSVAFSVAWSVLKLLERMFP